MTEWFEFHGERIPVRVKRYRVLSWDEWIYELAADHGVPPPKQLLKGKRNRLPDEAIREIRSSPLSDVELAEMFKRTKESIRAIRSYKAYREVDD